MLVVSYTSLAQAKPVTLFSSSDPASARREHDYWVREFNRRCITATITTAWKAAPKSNVIPLFATA
jgi:hypothetical protein